MFQVLLCDDEPSVTAFLKKAIPWESLGIRQVFTAADGREALAVFQENQIDLLITDIRMPHMDGLQLLEAVRREYPDSHCILLTAYGEFEYARAAFRLGVDNYLLKPLQTEELTGTIENTVENMYLHRQNREPLFRENILRRWLTNSIGESELEERSELLDDINFWQSSYCAVPMRKKEQGISLSAYAEACIRILSGHYDCLTVWDNSGHYVLIISGRQIDRGQLSKILRQTALQMDITDKLLVGIGITADRSADLSISYQGALHLLETLPDSPQDFLFLVSERDTLLPPPALSLDYGSLSPIVQKAVAYIHTNYKDGVSIKEFCSHHTITTSYLGYLFKKETNTFFNNYLNAYRLEKAIELLTDSHERINTIAEKCGYTSTSYFIASFRKQMGMSPQKYREYQQ